MAVEKFTTPIAVDLDGSLLLTDTLWESVAGLLRKSPWLILLLPIWLLRGRAYLKEKLSRDWHPDAHGLPMNHELLEWLHEQKANGRLLVLATAANENVAEAVAKSLGIFSAVIASSATENLKGETKAAAIENYFCGQPFSYVGDCGADMAVWEKSASAIVAGAGCGRLVKRLQEICAVEAQFPLKTSGVSALLTQLRPHQWAKNLLLLSPAVAGQDFLRAEVLQNLALAFISISLAASAIYVVNDLVDLENDRNHPRKRLRPLASGQLSLIWGFLLPPGLLTLSILLSLQLATPFQLTLILYLLVTSLYTFYLKKVPILDCLTLATLYTLRVIAGAAAANQTVTMWLLTFAVFIFFSLALVKRFVEVREAEDIGRTISGRGYLTGDLAFLHTTGISSGLVSVLILGLYIQSPAVSSFYSTVEVLWLCIGIYLYWICYIWIKASRGEMHDDPVVFSLKDPTSMRCGVMFILCALAASEITIQ